MNEVKDTIIEKALSHADKKKNQGLLVDDGMDLDKMDWSQGDPETIHSLVSLFSDDERNDGSWDSAIYSALIAEFPWLIRDDMKYYKVLVPGYRNMEVGEIYPADHYPYWKSGSVGFYANYYTDDFEEVGADDFFVFNQISTRINNYFEEKYAQGLFYTPDVDLSAMDKSKGEPVNIESIVSYFCDKEGVASIWKEIIRKRLYWKTQHMLEGYEDYRCV